MYYKIKYVKTRLIYLRSKLLFFFKDMFQNIYLKSIYFSYPTNK